MIGTHTVYYNPSAAGTHSRKICSGGNAVGNDRMLTAEKLFDAVNGNFSCYRVDVYIRTAAVEKSCKIAYFRLFCGIVNGGFAPCLNRRQHNVFGCPDAWKRQQNVASLSLIHI